MVAYLLDKTEIYIIHRIDHTISVCEYLPMSQISAENRRKFAEWWLDGHHHTVLTNDQKQYYKDLLTEALNNDQSEWQVKDRSGVKFIDSHMS